MGYYLVKKVPSGIKFDLKAGNHETVATSEVYTSEKACMNGIESVRKSAPIATIEDQTEQLYTTETNPKFELYADKRGAFRFRLKARNGEIIAVSEGYTSKEGCINGIESVRKNAFSSEVKKDG